VVLSRYFASAEEYGAYQAVTWFASFLPPLLTLGIGKAVYWFLPRVSRPRAFLMRTLLLCVGAGGLCAASLPVVDRRGVLPLVTAAILAVAFSDRLLEPVLVSLGRTRRLAALQAAFGAVILVAILIPVGLRRPLPDVLLGLLACYAAQAAVLVVVCLRAPRTADGRPLPTLREHAAYALPVGLGGGLAQVAQHLDKLVAWFGITLAGYAVYQRGAMEVPLFSSIAFLALSAITPDLVRRHAEGDRAAYQSLFREASRLIAAASLPFFVFFLFTARDFIVLLYGEPYAGSAVVFRLYLGLIPLRVVWSQTLLETSGHARAALLCGALLLAIHLPLSLLLLSPERPWGPAASMLVAHFVAFWLVGLPLCARLQRTPVQNLVAGGGLARVLIAAGAAAVVLLPLRALDLPRVLGLGLSAAAYFPIAFVLLVVTGALKPAERAYLFSPFSRRSARDLPPPL
jgi:O-antigen/teichoic acid export membrane protein